MFSVAVASFAVSHLEQKVANQVHRLELFKGLPRYVIRRLKLEVESVVGTSHVNKGDSRRDDCLLNQDNEEARPAPMDAWIPPPVKPQSMF